MVAKASSIGADLVMDYTICHHNWQYDFLFPSDAEIVSAYQTLYGADAHVSDAESSDSEEDAEEDADAVEDGEEDGMAVDT